MSGSSLGRPEGEDDQDPTQTLLAQGAGEMQQDGPEGKTSPISVTGVTFSIKSPLTLLFGRPV